MRKLCFVLTALLLTVPAMAGIKVQCNQIGSDPCVVISYQMDGGDTNLPRGFGLDITVDNGRTIENYSDANEIFWVYPGNITITDGNVTSQGDPIAPSGDPCTKGQLGDAGVTIEMGSLWDPCDVNHPVGPVSTGTLLTLILSDVDCNVAIVGNSARGNVVLENTVEAVVDYNGCHVEGVPPCWTGDATSLAEWQSVGSPDCWCISINPRQCHGDADALNEGKLSYWVAGGDLGILLAAWSKAYPDMVGQSTNGVPWICADFDHEFEGKLSYRVAGGDLGILLKNWSMDNGPDPNCADAVGSQE